MTTIRIDPEAMPLPTVLEKKTLAN